MDEQRSFLERTAGETSSTAVNWAAVKHSRADPRNTYLVWQGAMKVAKEAGTHADYINPEILLPRALHYIVSTTHK